MAPSLPEDQNQAVQAEELNDEVPAAVPAEEPAAAESKLYRNAAGNIRFGSDAIRALGMLPESCTLDYEEGEEPTSEPEPASVVTAPAPVATVDDEPAAVTAAEPRGGVCDRFRGRTGHFGSRRAGARRCGRV